VNAVEKELSDSVARKKVAEHQFSNTTVATSSQHVKDTANYDILVKKFIRTVDHAKPSFGKKVAICGITLLVLALLGGFFMFLMRQTIIVMSRHMNTIRKMKYTGTTKN